MIHNNKLKGSLEGVLPMLALFIIAGTVSFQSIPISSALADVMGDSTSDINRVIDARTYGEYYFYSTIPQISEYSANDAAQEQASNGGDIQWTSATIQEYEDTISSVKDNWINETEKRFNSEIEPASSESCQVVADDDREYSIEIYPGKSDFRNTDDPYSLIEPDITEHAMETSCTSEDGTTNYRETAEVRPKVEVTSNRYMQLVDETTRFFLDLQDELSSVSSETDTHSSCGSYPSYSGVEEDAAQALENSVQNAIDEAESGYPERDGFEVTSMEILTDASYKHGYSSSLVDATSSDDRWTGSCCSGCGNPNVSNSYTHYTEVEVNPSSTELKWSIKDTAQRIIANRNLENLEFVVESYEHEFQ